MPPRTPAELAVMATAIEDFLCTAPDPFIGSIRDGFWVQDIAELIIEYMEFDSKLKSNKVCNVVKQLQSLIKPHVTKSWVDAVITALPILAPPEISPKDRDMDAVLPGDIVWHDKKDQVSSHYQSISIRRQLLSAVHPVSLHQEARQMHNTQKCQEMHLLQAQKAALPRLQGLPRARKGDT